MIQPAAPALVPLLAASPLPAGGGGEGGVFALSLANFLGISEASDATPLALPEAGSERQGDADDGNMLPDEPGGNAPDSDPALAWLAVLAPIPPAPRPIAFVAPPPIAVPSTAPVGLVSIPSAPTLAGDEVSRMPPAPATDIGAEAIFNASLVGPALGEVSTIPERASPAMPATRPDPAPAAPPEPAGKAAPSTAVAAKLDPVPPSVLALLAAAKAIVLPASFAASPARALPARSSDPRSSPPSVAAPIVTATVPVPMPAPGATADRAPIAGPVAAAIPSDDITRPPPQSAKVAGAPPAPVPNAAPQSPVLDQALASALRAVASDDRPATTARLEEERTPVAIAGSPAEARTIAVAASGDTQQAPLDLGQQRWTHTIIDRIERMRDGIDAADTRIRLVPDALGSIDVSVRKQGDTLHVHFAAEQAATRTILQDAQPRLAEIAESRGLKLGQTGVGAGSGDGHRQSPQPQPRQSHSPRPSAVRARAAEQADDRLA